MASYETPLQTYQLIYAVTQQAVNLQIAWAHAQLSPGQGWIEFGDAWSEDSTTGGIRGRLAAPVLDFSGGSATQVRLTLGFDPRYRPSAAQLSSSASDNKASMTGPAPVNMASLWVGRSRRPVLLNLDCSDWLLSFDIDLDRADTAHDHPLLPAGVRAQLGDFEPERMSIERLFLDLTQPSRLKLLAASSSLPLPAWLQDVDNAEILSEVALSTALGARQLAGSESSLFDLGYMIKHSGPGARPLFAPTGASYSTKAVTDSDGKVQCDEGSRSRATLNFLLNTDDRPVETRVESYGAFQRKNLVLQGGVHVGTLIVTAAEFDAKIVGPLWDALMRGLQAHTDPPFGGGERRVDRHAVTRPPPRGQPWTLDHALLVRNSHGDVDTYEDCRTFSLQLQAVPGGVRFSGTGRVALEQKFERYRDMGFLGESYEGKAWHSSASDLVFNLWLTVDPASGRIVVTPGIEGGRIFARHNEAEDNSSTGLQSLFNDGGQVARMKQALDACETDVEDAVTTALTQALDGLRVGVLFPMPGDVRFSQLRLSEDGDLEIDLVADVQTVAVRGEAHRVKAEIDRAMADLDWAIGLVPDYPWALASRGACHFMRSDAVRALADFDRAIALNPEHAFALSARGELHCQSGQVALAIDDFTRALAVQPNDAITLTRRSVAHRQTGHFDEALRDLDSALALNPGYTPALFDRGEFHAQRGQDDAAVADFDRLLAVEPGHTWAVARRRAVWIRLGQWDAVLADFAQALARDPQDVAALVGRAQTHYTLGQYAEALADFDRALALNPHNATAFASRGETHRALGQFELGLADHERALALVPQFAYALFARGAIHAQTGRWREAIADFDRGLAIEPTNDFYAAQRSLALAALAAAG